MFKKGHRHSIKTKRLMSVRAQGRKNPFYGKRHAAKSKQKISAAAPGKNNPTDSKDHTKKARLKMRLARLRLLRLGKKKLSSQ